MLADALLVFFVLTTALLLFGLLTGWLVEQQRLAVGDSRQLKHFALFFLPGGLAHSLSDDHASSSSLWASLAAIHVLFVLYSAPLRRARWCTIIFQSIDRPEDGPQALAWRWSWFPKSCCTCAGGAWS